MSHWKICILLSLVVFGLIGMTVQANVQKGQRGIAIPALNSNVDSTVYIVNESLLRNINTKGLYDVLLNKMKKHGFQVILFKLNENEKRTFLKAWLKALGEMGYRPSVIPIEKIGKDKRSLEFDKRLLKAEIVVLSYRPNGIFIVERTSHPAEDIATILKVGSASTNIKNFQYIGYIGWKTESSDDTGKECVKVDYYIAKTEVGGKTYRFFLALPQHSAVGYDGYSPKKFITVTDWNTNVWSGQVLHDWGPKNEGSNTQITYTLTASAGLQGEEPVVVASATVSYSVQGGLVIKWIDQTSPDTGYVKTVHEIPDSKSDVTYTVEPSSIGLLDPTKSGGVLPMIVDHDFEVELQKQVWWWTDTKTIDIDFTVALYDNSVNEI